MSSPQNLNKPSWQTELATLFTDPIQLLAFLELDPALAEAALRASHLFPLKVTRHYAALIEKGNPNDPLLRQVLPLDLELKEIPGFNADPLQELSVNKVPGLLHKYPDRVLVTLTSACAIHCRYCFRRSFPYAENNPGIEGWEKIFAYISQHKAVREVILSGGDPLTVNDKYLKLFMDKLAHLSQIKRLRIHTRLPVVLPNRITKALLDILTGFAFIPVIVIHANHPQEISQQVAHALKMLKTAGISVLNQSVLLKGVNDDAKVLAALSEKLWHLGVQPYYLHLLDKVAGAAHFDIDLIRAREIHAELTHQLSGYLVPKLVVEEPGKLAKTIVTF